MDGTVIMPVLRTVPTGLSFERAWRWCLLSAIRDLRRSAARRRTMSLPNTRRLFLRRFNDACAALGVSEDASLRTQRAELGTRFVCPCYESQVARADAWAHQD